MALQDQYDHHDYHHNFHHHHHDHHSIHDPYYYKYLADGQSHNAKNKDDIDLQHYIFVTVQG